MKQELSALLTDLKENKKIFSEVIAFIETYYQHQPTAFKNGDTYNEATQNQGSAKVLSFAKINGLGAEDTLLLFAEHYQSVLAHPDATDHQNIRQFMAHGWTGVVFEGEALVAKN
ncbi:HopJ type III effector protein [Mucilaginibacter celer]|uniref:HopJ type III effector protein n=1 Tax=Mucilaginibacter celer TaxID=2305508 RepID=A0A494W357_9SPHI|nr:HopJ type III effector protein [Mucilaginibacter celer]AYL97945.1 HopJ type III effector protein [Mucilaginibacter celer]